LFTDDFVFSGPPMLTGQNVYRTGDMKPPATKTDMNTAKSGHAESGTLKGQPGGVAGGSPTKTGGSPVTPMTELPTQEEVVPCVTRFELAGLLRVSVRTVDRMIAAGEIRVRRVRGKAVRFLHSDVENYLNGGTLKAETRISRIVTNHKHKPQRTK
jgi:excisionase family DNA binding protein